MIAKIQSYALVGLFAILLYLYYNNDKLNDEFINTKQINSTLEENLKTEQQYIKNVQEEIQQVKDINNSLNKSKEEQQREIDSLKDKFQKHDLAKISYKKPKAVQKIINKATFSEFRCIENITKGNNNECK